MAPGLCSQGTWPTLTLIGRARDLQGLWPARLPQLDEKPPKGKSFFFSILHYPAGPSFPLATERTSLFGMAKGAIDTNLSANLGRPCSGHQKFPFPHFAFFFIFSCNSSNWRKEKNKASTQSRNCKNATRPFHRNPTRHVSAAGPWPLPCGYVSMRNVSASEAASLWMALVMRCHDGHSHELSSFTESTPLTDERLGCARPNSDQSGL